MFSINTHSDVAFYKSPQRFSLINFVVISYPSALFTLHPELVEMVTYFLFLVLMVIYFATLKSKSKSMRFSKFHFDARFGKSQAILYVTSGECIYLLD